MRKSLFNYSFYSHPEIWKFQGVTLSLEHMVGESVGILSSAPRAAGAGMIGAEEDDEDVASVVVSSLPELRKMVSLMIW